MLIVATDDPQLAAAALAAVVRTGKVSTPGLVPPASLRLNQSCGWQGSPAFLFCSVANVSGSF
jgi:hypothetical protein